MRVMPLPSFGGEKARRLFWAVKNDGIVKVAPDGFTWIFEKKPRTLISDGTVFPAAQFATMAAEMLEIRVNELFEADDEALRQVARKLAGIDIGNARIDARGLDYAEQ